MHKKYVCIIKWAAPIMTMIFGIIQLADVPFPKWASISLLIIIAILYAIALYVERKNKQEKNMRNY